ncbi:hypothetical protein NAP1_11533 [Erythrobacter sp. NAP1]|uniref:nucleotidyltransferase family protein n=1 Tax=Erythrobacter sp. NAP1 TaxID=237727 RepID=UPI0000687941|nr:nucleotidyltransferase family protein [Erythrobacter sp. NAP1]EAQ28224.1 hypothetical protein NAP1_11533 [Erythrobacter sp. NAP1]
MTDTASVDRFLAQCLRSLRASDPAGWDIADSAEWHDVWLRIEYHGIALLLHNNSAHLTDWPSALIDRIAEEARLIALWEATHHKLVSAAVRKLAEERVTSVILKGTALAYSLHAEPATRRRGDTDLLVCPGTLEHTREVLTELGWERRVEPHGLYFQEGWTHEAAGFFVHSIDLHWKPVDRPTLHEVLPLELVFEGKLPLPKFDDAAFRPNTATMILHAVINQKWHAEHGYFAEDGRVTSQRRLIWSIDFDLMVRAMSEDEWAVLADHCIAEGIAPLVAEALVGMSSDLGTPLPPIVESRLKKAKLAPDLKAYFSEHDTLAQFKLDLSHTKGAGSKAKLLLSRAFPPRRHLVERYPETQGWPTLALQGRMLLETAARFMRQGHSR